MPQFLIDQLLDLFLVNRQRVLQSSLDSVGIDFLLPLELVPDLPPIPMQKQVGNEREVGAELAQGFVPGAGSANPQ